MKRRHLLLALLSLVGASVSAQTFPFLNWSVPLPAPAFGSAAAADVDGDGKFEIIFTTYTNDGKAHCLNGEDGSVLWTFDIGGCGDVAPVIYDLDGDDTLDVFINGSCNPTCFSINAHTGALNWSKPSGGGDSPPTVADIDNDGLPEVLFGNFSGQVRILNGEDGSTNRSIQFDPFFGPIQTEPTIGDLDGDGDLDFLVANHFNNDGFHVWAYDYAANDTLWTYYRTADSNVTYHAYHGGVLADVDNDTKLEYVIGTNDGAVYALNGEDGSLLWETPGFTNVISALSCANFDSDSALEIVFTNNDYLTFDDRAWLLDGATGGIDWSSPITFSAFRGPAISDINGNGMLDVITGHYMGEIMAHEPFTGQLWVTDVDTFFNSLPYYLLDHGTLIADFNVDGNMDFFSVAGYGTYTPDSLNTGMAFCFTAGSGDCPEWLMFRQDVHRSAYLSDAEIAASCAVLGKAEPQKGIVSVYPNPSSGSFTFEAPAFSNETGDLTIHDLQGRKMYQRILIGGTKTTLNLDLPSGTYFWQMNAEGMAPQSGKLLLLR